MNLNKKGWGIPAELGFLLLFVICIIVVTVGISKSGLFKTVNESINPNYYDDEFDYKSLENNLVNGTKEYILEVHNNKIDTDTIVVNAKYLVQNNYIVSLLDDKNKTCSGYTEVSKENNEIIYKPYIKCNEYETDGYLERIDEK